MAQKWEGRSLVGQRLGQFEVKDEIARGGMGVVYKGYQPSLDRWVAIKTLPIDLAGDRDLVARFQREAEAMVRLNHANIVQIIDRGEDQGQYYFAMEFVEGPSVKDLLKSETIDTDKIFDILCQTCDGLDYAHKKGLVHRDIKPANLLFEEKTGVVKIADFGIAHFSKKDEDMLTLTADNVGMGTMNYMSPEQKVNAKNVDHHSDIYALGVIIYEAFTGKLPMGKFKLPSEVNPKLPRALDAIVQKCLEAEPNDRWDSCASLRAALAEAKAATHDKTLKRSMRDAFDRTLTAFGPNRGVGLCVLGFLFLLFMGGLVGGGFLFLRNRSQKDKVEHARASALAKQEAAKKLGADHTKSFEDGNDLLKQGDEASSTDAKVDYYERADKKFEAAQGAAAEARAKKSEELRDAVKKLRDHPATKHDDGLAKAGNAALDKADDLAKKVDDLDENAVRKLLADASAALDASDAIAQKEQDLRSQIEKANQDDANVKKAKEQLDAALAARDKGDGKAALEAWNAAQIAIGEATKKPPDVIVTRPTATPVGTPEATDPQGAMLTREIESARGKMDAARQDAEDVLREARAIDVAAGAERVKDGKNAAADALALKGAEALKKLEDAKGIFLDAADVTLRALEERVKSAKDKAQAAGAEKLASDAFNEAAAAQGSAAAGGGSPPDRARFLVKAARRYEDAASSALEQGMKAVLDQKPKAQQAREKAVKRVGDGHRSLEAGDAALKRANDAIDAKRPSVALAELQSAVERFDQAQPGTPSRAAYVDRRYARKLGDLEPLDAVAACSLGFVVACPKVKESTESRLSCFAPDFSSAASERVSGSRVVGLCSGDGDDIYAALITRKLVRFKIGNAIDGPVELPGKLAKPLDDFVNVIAYDRKGRRLYAASPGRDVNVYSIDTGEIASRPLALTGSNLSVHSMTVLSDQSVVVAAQTLETRDLAEADWKFVLKRFGPDGKLMETNERVNVSAVAAAGDGFLAIRHVPSGEVFVWKTPKVDSPPEPLLVGAPDDARPVFGLALSVFGRKAYVLDHNDKQKQNRTRLSVAVFDLSE